MLSIVLLIFVSTIPYLMCACFECLLIIKTRRGIFRWLHKQLYDNTTMNLFCQLQHIFSPNLNEKVMKKTCQVLKFTIFETLK